MLQLVLRRCRFWALAVVFLGLGATSLLAEKPKPVPRPPVAEKIPHVSEIHGEKLVDNYFWLRSDDPENDQRVMAHLKAENSYAEAMLAPTQPLQKKLYDEFLARMQQTDLEVPVKFGEYFYYSRTVEKQNYPIHCRKHKSLAAPEEVLLDENALAAGHEYFSVGDMKVSDNHQLLAYAVDLEGNERYTLHVLDLVEKKLRPDVIENTAEGLAWSADASMLYYLMADETERPFQLYRHKLGSDPEKDELLYEETDDKFYLSLTKTKSRQFILLSSDSKTTSEVRYVKASEPAGEFRVVEPRKLGVEYAVDHHGDSFYILTNADGAKNFKLMQTPVAAPGQANWTEVAAHRPEVKLDGVELFEKFLVFEERAGGLPTLRVRDLSSGKEHAIEFPDPAYSVETGPNLEFDSQTLRFTYSSLVAPTAVVDYDLAAHTRELKKEQAVLGKYDRAEYVTERLAAQASDGTQVPISLVYKKGLQRNGANPCLLYGYGAYGLSDDPSFSSARLSLLDRGWVYAVAHVRGGGERGRFWYEDGKLEKKANSFTDFIACAEHLVREKFTSPERLAITGGSAGGLLVGAAVNMRPDLFHAVVADVPFVDTLNTMLDDTLPLTVTEYDEWGDPHEKQAFERIRGYSPYDNVRPVAYPHMLILGSLADTHVCYWEPAKWAAKLRATKTDPHPLLLKINLNAGHGGVSGRYQALEEQALVYAFLLSR